jgi:sugar transferase (PEP-CTERM/EpsH1 system associated)
LRILYLCHRVPYPPNKGEKIRAFHQLQALSTRHEVDLFTLSDEPADEGAERELKRYCRRVVIAPINGRAARLRALPWLLSRRPLTLPCFDSAELRGAIREALLRRSYDCGFVYCSAMTPYLERVPDLPMVMDFVDMDSQKWAQYAETALFPASLIYRSESRRLREHERATLERAAYSIVTTEREARLARKIAGDRPARIEVIPNGVDADFFRPREGGAAAAGPAIVFTGDMRYFPNVEAVRWFTLRVFPRIRREVPDAQFLIVGRSPVAAVRRLAKEPAVEVTGFVPDTREYLARARVAVAPFTIAAGIQNKVLEAMASGLPVVATRKVLESLTPAVAGVARCGDSAEEMAAGVIDLLRDARLAGEVGAEGRRRVMSDYDWGLSGEVLLGLVEAAAPGIRTRNGRVPAYPGGA